MIYEDRQQHDSCDTALFLQIIENVALWFGLIFNSALTIIFSACLPDFEKFKRFSFSWTCMFSQTLKVNSVMDNCNNPVSFFCQEFYCLFFLLLLMARFQQNCFINKCVTLVQVPETVFHVNTRDISVGNDFGQRQN